jgi:hypothetical protein
MHAARFLDALTRWEASKAPKPEPVAAKAG